MNVEHAKVAEARDAAQANPGKRKLGGRAENSTLLPERRRRSAKFAAGSSQHKKLTAPESRLAWATVG